MFRAVPKPPATTTTLLSDHMPFLAKNESISLASWNILCKMQFDTQWNYFNNGFNCKSESDAQYSSRLSHLVINLKLLMETERPSFICLQECPESLEHRQEFARKIKLHESFNHYQIHYFHIVEDEYYLMTLYDRRAFRVNQALSDAIARVPLKEGLVGRILPLVFFNQTRDTTTLVVNIHAKFPQDVQDDIKTLYQAAIELGINHVAFLGDFNRDLVVESDNYSKHDIAHALDASSCFAKGLQVKAIRGSSFCSTYNKETQQASQKIETRDGIMSTFPVETVCMTHVNEVKPSQALSPDLALVPKDFLERLDAIEDLSPVVSLGN